MTVTKNRGNSIKDRAYWTSTWVLFKSGEKSAFEEIYAGYIDVLFNFGLKLTNDQELVKDSIQDLFIDLFRYEINLRKPESLDYYLFKALKRIITKRLSKKNKLDELDFRAFDLRIDFENEYIQNETEVERLNLLQNVLNEMNENNRELLFYKFNSNLSYKEIGQILGVKPDTVRKQISRIITGIKDDFKHRLPDLFVLCFIA